MKRLKLLPALALIAGLAGSIGTTSVTPRPRCACSPAARTSAPT